MKLNTIVQVKDSKDYSDLYNLFCRAFKGGFVKDFKDGDKTLLRSHENLIGDEFDKFAQIFFDQGRKYERNVKNEN